MGLVASLLKTGLRSERLHRILESAKHSAQGCYREAGKLDPLMAGQVKRILDENKAERHIRGGEATG